jgi:hypothetical protein
MSAKTTHKRRAVERRLTPATLARLKETRDQIMRGRRFDDSTEILRRFREGRDLERPAP